jgi:hypothetical protein
MKRIVLLLLVSGMATLGYSQFLKKGSIIGGGTFQFKTSNNHDFDSKGTSFSIAPLAGYFVAKNLALGASFEYGYSTSKNSSLNYKGSTSSVFLSPFVRYYLDKGLFFHSQYGFGPTKVKAEIDGIKSENEVNSSLWRLGVGYAARISDTVLFEPMMGYYASGVNDTKIDGFFIMGGFTIILKNVK